MRFSFPMLVFATMATKAHADCTNLVPNGSFETVTYAGQFQKVEIGDTNIDDWEVINGNVDIIGSYWQASDGGVSIDLQGTSPGGLKSAAISTQVGTAYILKFAMSGNPLQDHSNDGVPKTMTMTVDGNSYSFSYDVTAKGNTNPDMRWVEEEVTFVASSTSTYIQFVETTASSGHGVALDDVRLYPQDCRTGGMGDPHFHTFGNEWYDFHGVCDLVLLSAPEFDGGKGLNVHVRTKPRGDFSYIEAAAIKIGEDVLQIASYGEYSLNGVDQAKLEGILLGGGQYRVSHEQQDAQHHKFVVSLGKDEALVIKTHKDMVNVGVDNASSDHFAGASGLMGSFDSHGLLLARDGATILADHDLFGQEWRVIPEADGELFQSPSPYQQGVCLPPHEVMEGRRLGEAAVTREDAAEACKGALRREMCISDVIAMADLDVAQSGSY